MKQKRKVKSLLPQKNDLWGSLLTATLLVLGLALCLWSASLMTSSVWAASSNPAEYSQFQYSWTDDKVEVLYNLQFSKPEYLSGFVGEMYTDKNNDFYITSTPITVNESGVKAEDVNEVDKWLYSNILGWHKNKVHSNYVTTIWWEENVIATWNPNAVIFWWKNNEISWSAAWNPSAIVWWHHNLIKGGHNWNTIIWWHDNSISWSVSNSFILGWINNKIVSDKWINNVIVWGSNVTVDTWDVFVFSDSAFKPQGNKTFYLNVSQWLWINTESAGKWVTVNGPVKFGEIDITKPEYPCNTSTNYGVIWSWNGCLVWCTPTTAVDGQWDLLDRWKRCQEACDNEDKCSNKMPAVKEPDAYSGFCTNGVNTGNASPCTPVWDEVKDVVFETALINSVQYGGKCPEADAVNKCVFQCNSGYYLTWDRTYSSSVNGGQIGCYSICDLSKDLWPEWVNPDWTPIILKHNQMVTGYNTNDTTCARDNPYTNKDNWTAGEPFPEHCGNNKHKQPLVCVNWKMEIANGYNNPRSSSKNAKANWYTHRDCAVHPFTCDTSAGKFDLNRYYITTTLYDTPIVTDTEKDRKNMVWTRWTYKLCLDYDVLNSPNNEKAPWNEVCNVHLGNDKPYIEHYQFIGCNSTYHRSNRDGETDKYICRKECKISTDKGVRTVWDNRSITLYDRTEAECWKSLCKEETFTCNDGVWDKPQGIYTHESCTQKWDRCDGYNVDKSTHDAHTYNSQYRLCEKRMPFLPTSNQPNWTYKTYRNDNWYLKSNYTSIQECSYEQRYLLVGCDDCLHATTSLYCDNDKNVSWGSSCSSVSNWVVAGYHYNIWTSTTWNGGSFLKNQWKCEYYCNDGYYDNGSSCSANPERKCEKPEDGSWYYYTARWSSDYTKWYVAYDKKSNESGHVWELLEEWNWCTDSCKDGYRQVKGSCVSTSKENRWCIWTIPYNAVNIDNDHDDSMYPWIYHHISEGGQDCSFDCPIGYTWNGYACEYDGWNCSRCTHKATLDANWWTIVWGVDSVSGPCNTWQSLPQAELACHEFLWWWWSDKPMQVFLDSNKELVAQWWPYDSSMIGCSTEFDCKWGTPPMSPSDRYTTGPSPKFNDMPWTPVDDYSKELTECQWRCNMEYIREGDKCVEVKCKAWDKPWDNPPAQNVDKWPDTYLRTSLTDTNRKWKQWNPSNPCEWKCKSGFELSWSRDAGYECVKTVIAGCETIANGYCPTWNNRQDLVNLTVWAIKSWEKWKCKWTATTPKECVECLPGYKLTWNSYANYKCDVYNCKTPAPSGEGVLKWATTYTGENVVDNKEWNYLSGNVTAAELKACEWRCLDWFVRSGNSCIPSLQAKCSKPEEHYHCEDDTTMQAIDKVDIKVSWKTAWWKWKCAPKSGSTGDTENCLECNEDMGFQETWEGDNRTCAKDQDGVCAYDWSYCSAWTSGLVTDITANWKSIWEHWICEGIGNWKDEPCKLAWDCDGSCAYYGDAGCQGSATDIYPNNGAGYAWFNKKEICESAGYMKMSGGGITPCHLYGTMPSPYHLIPGCIGTYGSCAKWTADLKCIVGDYKAVTYHGNDAIEQCSAISAMKPNCENSTPVYPGKIECEDGWEITWTNNPSCGNAPWWAEQYDATQEWWRYRYGHKSQEVCMDRWKMAWGLETVPWNPNIPCFTCSCTNNEGEAPKKIQVTVIIPNSTPQCLYSDFLLIRRDYWGHVSPNGNYSWQQSNNGETHAVTFEVSHDWVNKAVTMQLDKTCNYGYVGSSTVGGTNGDWVIPDHDVSFTYTDPAGV